MEDERQESSNGLAKVLEQYSHYWGQAFGSGWREKRDAARPRYASYLKQKTISVDQEN